MFSSLLPSLHMQNLRVSVHVSFLSCAGCRRGWWFGDPLSLWLQAQRWLSWRVWTQPTRYPLFIESYISSHAHKVVLLFMWKAVEWMSSAECHVHRHVEGFIVSWQNGTRCREVWKYCHSHLVWLVFEGSISYMHLFSFRKLFVTCSCCFLFFILEWQGRREVGGEAKGKTHGL